MKKILLIVAVFFCYGNVTAQINLPPEYKVIIANLNGDAPQTVDYSLNDLSIESKISWILKLNIQDINLVNPTILEEFGKGWFLQYEFATPTYAGIYKEKLHLIDNQLIISESRSAMMAIATNCNEIQFSDETEERCKCVNLKDTTQQSEITYRLFSSER